MIELATYRCAAAGFAIPLPAGWETSEEVERAALVAVEPDRGGAFRSNVVVTGETRPVGLGVAGWAERCAGLLSQELDHCRVLDTGNTVIGRLPARRALVRYAHPELRRPADRATVMTAAVDFDPDTGTLLASQHALNLLLAYLASGRWPPRGAETDELYALRRAGAVHGDGQPAQALAPAWPSSYVGSAPFS